MLLPLNIVVRVIREKYNILRFHAINLVSHHVAFQTYYHDYLSFISHIKRKWPHLIELVNNNSATLLVRRGKGKLLHLKPKYQKLYNKFIYGINSYYKYAAVKKILLSALTYERELYFYLRKNENFILHFLKLVRKFRQSYTNFLTINMKEEEEGNNEYNNNLLDPTTNYHLQKIYENNNWQRLITY